MTRQRRFAEVGQAGRKCVLAFHGCRRQFDFGHDAGGLDRFAAGREVACGGQLHRVPVIERQHGLHRALAERAAADHACALVVTQRPGEHLRGARRAGVHQHHHRCTLQQVARRGVEAGIADADASPCADDVPFLDQVVRDLHRRRQQAAGVAAQIQHEPFELPAGLLGQLPHMLLEVRPGVGLERAQADVAVARFQHPAAHAGHPDGLARKTDVEWPGLAVAGDGQHDLAAGRPAQWLTGFDRADRFAVDRDDQVTGQDTGPGSGRSVDRGNDLQAAFVRLLLQLHADAFIGTVGLLIERFGIFLVEVGAVRIQVQQQSAHCVLHQFLVIDRIHVGRAHRVVDRNEAPDLLQRHLRGRRLLTVSGLPRRGVGGRCGGGCRLLGQREGRHHGQQQGGGSGYTHEALLGVDIECSGEVRARPMQVSIMRQVPVNSC